MRKTEREIMKEIWGIECTEEELLNMLGNCYIDKTEQCIGCGACIDYYENKKI